MPNIGLTSSRRQLWRWMGLGLLPIAAAGLWALYLLATDNFHVIAHGQAYRAGQMDSNRLACCIERQGIRSIINLRGEHPEETWYRDEVQVAQSQHVIHRSLALSSAKAVSEQQWREVVHLLRTVPKPVLIHCNGGADRTAFVAATYAAEMANKPVEEAAREFSLWYGYWPFVWKKKEALRHSFFANVARSTHYGRIDSSTQ